MSSGSFPRSPARLSDLPPTISPLMSSLDTAYWPHHARRTMPPLAAKFAAAEASAAAGAEEMEALGKKGSGSEEAEAEAEVEVEAAVEVEVEGGRSAMRSTCSSSGCGVSCTVAPSISHSPANTPTSKQLAKHTWRAARRVCGFGVGIRALLEAGEVVHHNAARTNLLVARADGHVREHIRHVGREHGHAALRDLLLARDAARHHLGWAWVRAGSIRGHAQGVRAVRA